MTPNTMSSDDKPEAFSEYDEKHVPHSDEKLETVGEYDEKTSSSFPPAEWLQRLKDEYAGHHSGEALPAGCDPDRMASSILNLTEDEAIQVLTDLLTSQKDDYTIDRKMLARIRDLLQGCEICEMESGDWAYEICKWAGLCRNWSPYAEVRAVTLPYDDIDEPCESFRAYLLGYFWVCVCTAVNACKWHLSTQKVY